MKIKRFYLLLILLVFQVESFSQNNSNVDAIVSKYPSNFQTMDDLILKIKSDFQSSTDKSKAAFYWICNNISYDMDLLKSVEAQQYAFSYKTQAELIEKEKKFNHDAAVATFKNKSAICFGYAALYAEILNKMGVECKIIRGNIKVDPSQIGEPLDLNHGWNIVKINNEWKLVDCTLAAGKISAKTNQFEFDHNDIYFFTKPELFYLNHYPLNQAVLLNCKYPENDYINFPIYYMDFFKNSDKISLPKKGNLPSNQQLTIKLTDLNNDYLDYKFSEDSERTPVEVDSATSEFSILLSGKVNQTLNLYLNNKLIAVYNII